jgi:hypothetical protein
MVQRAAWTTARWCEKAVAVARRRSDGRKPRRSRVTPTSVATLLLLL